MAAMANTPLPVDWSRLEGNVVSGCVVSGNYSYTRGIAFENRDGGAVIGNRVEDSLAGGSGNDTIGMAVLDHDPAAGGEVRDNVLVNNLIYRNDAGIMIEGDGSGDQIAGTVVAGNRLETNFLFAIGIIGGATGTVIRDNDISESAVGVELRGDLPDVHVTNTTITGNTFGYLWPWPAWAISGYEAVSGTSISENDYSALDPEVNGAIALFTGGNQITPGPMPEGADPCLMIYDATMTEQNPLGDNTYTGPWADLCLPGE
jgi:hypothetical protein